MPDLRFRGTLKVYRECERATNAPAASGSSPAPDFLCEDHGSIFLLRPVTQSAHSWIKEHLSSHTQWFGNGVVVEHRYVWAILEAIQDGGMAARGVLMGEEESASADLERSCHG